MKTDKKTGIKTYSKVSEFVSADTIDIVYDLMDHQKIDSVKNGTVISRQVGKRRIIDRSRNAIAHETVDYSTFKVTRIESGVTVDNSKKEADLESAAMALLADLGINWDEDEEIDEPEQEETEQQTVSNDEEVVESEEEEIETQTDSLIVVVRPGSKKRFSGIYAQAFSPDDNRLSNPIAHVFSDDNKKFEVKLIDSNDRKKSATIYSGSKKNCIDFLKNM